MMNRMVRIVSVMIAGSMLAACGTSPSSKTPATACTDLCKNAGYSSSKLETDSNETNCYCTGGSTDIAAADCTAMCKDISKSNAQAFKSSTGSVDSCQCS